MGTGEKVGSNDDVFHVEEHEKFFKAQHRKH